MQLIVTWASHTPDLFSGTAKGAWGDRQHVVAEELPGGGWDWVAWASDGSGRCLSGRADTREDSMRAAEQAATLLARSPMSGRPALPPLVLN